MPGLAQTRAQLDALRRENEALKARLGSGDVAGDVAELRRALAVAEERAEAAENRARDLEKRLETAIRSSRQEGDTEASDTRAEPENGALDSPETPTDYEKMSVPALQELSRERLLPTGGKKADLVARLQAYDERANER